MTLRVGTVKSTFQALASDKHPYQWIRKLARVLVIYLECVQVFSKEKEIKILFICVCENMKNLLSTPLQRFFGQTYQLDL